MEEEQRDEPGIVLGVLLIIAWALFAGGALAIESTQRSFTVRDARVLEGISLLIAALVFLLSFFFEHKSFLFRGIIWIFENLPDIGDTGDDYFLKPKGRGVSLVCSLVFFVGGAALLVHSLRM